MTELFNESSAAALPEGNASTPLKRRSFLRFTGAGVVLTGLVLAGCDDNQLDKELSEAASSDSKDDNNRVVNVGSGDFGILNFAYALEQLEAAFYAEVLRGGYFASASPAEKSVFKDIEAHERIHREFLKAGIAANGGTPIEDLEPDFSSVNFGSRTSVLATAKAFEDLGVAAYNGAGPLISNPVYLGLAGKIVSVEARHAALIRDLIQYNTFVTPDIVDPSTSVERSLRPSQVASMANKYLKPGSKINVSKLPRE
ncbi:ferritin-like domain-containing protein [Hymenobacter taeanensis]|uniref:Ferritin-like domain-containing protein n=1 Tax=Hymenobacter taeanensis TaxID=2735321 RepID=A0A6M6BKJ3_9BACT|nr:MULTISPECIES: ferritin-like domain-containing protein [Hymenobacter]QJX48522.1 ferritin-like domain-containing protein [Hymenobacter taeanensis]UOQ81980.1 ferritin-like domain-containing protein [Hymenobacter sp. 5414T-23]